MLPEHLFSFALLYQDFEDEDDDNHVDVADGAIGLSNVAFD